MHYKLHEKLAFYLGLFIVGLLVTACFQLAFVLQAGLPGSGYSLVERHDFIKNHLTSWQLGWFNWMLAALSLLTFCILLLPYIPKSEWRILGILLVGLGVVPDITAEIIFAFVIPYVHLTDPSLASMQLLELIAIQLTGALGNGLYNIGGLLLNMLLLNNHALPRKIIAIGIPGWFFGFGLSIATALQQFDWVKIFTGLGMVWSTAWMFLMTIKIFPHKAQYKVDY